MSRRARVLVARLDSAGDVLLAGPAVRAVASTGARVTMLCSSRGLPVAGLLPGVDEIRVLDAPWVLADPPPVRWTDLGRALLQLRRGGFDDALVLTSFHQSALPTALLLRLAGVPRISAVSEDYPGSLLDVRISLPDGLHEASRAAAIATAAGYPADDDALRVRADLPDVSALVPAAGAPYVVVHPGTDAPARRWPADHARAAVAHLLAAGMRVVVTGSPDERLLARAVSAGRALDVAGRTSWAQLAAVLRGARAVVVGNTGPAHLAAAVGTPVVSLFAPTVPAQRWGPHGVPHTILGDQQAACAGTRARACPVPGHPCLASVSGAAAAEAALRLAGVSA